VQYRVTGTGTWTTASSSVTDVSYAVIGLTAATSYDFQVTAVNAAGAGTPSASVSTTTTASPPGQVTGLTAGTATASSVPLTWTAPGTGGAVATYTVQYRLSGGATWTTASSSVTGVSYTVTGLNSSTAYDFQVIAVNAAGSGTPSSSITASTAIAAPGQVSGLAVGTATSTSVPLSWTAPATGGAVATYTVQYRISGGSTWTTASSSVTGVTYTVTGLAGATAYEFQVFAVNAGGAGTPSSTVAASTLAAPSYLLTNGTMPAAGTTATAGVSNIGVNCNDNSSVSDGSRTVPASVKFGFSTSNTVEPATFLAGSQTSANAHNYWARYIATPTTPGTYYTWCRAYDAGNNQVFQLILTNTVQVN